MIHVIATIQIAPGRREAFLSEFRRVMPLVQAETGCLEYGPAIDLETSIPAQEEIRDNVVVVLEKWEDIEALEDHLMAPHMLQYRSRVKELVQHVTLQVLEPAAEAKDASREEE